MGTVNKGNNGSQNAPHSTPPTSPPTFRIQQNPPQQDLTKEQCIQAFCQQTAKALGEVIIGDNGAISASSLTKEKKLKIWENIISKMNIPPTLEKGINLAEAAYQKYEDNKQAYIENTTQKIIARYYAQRHFEKNMSQSVKIDPVFPSTPSPDSIIAEIARNIISDLHTDILKSQETHMPIPLDPLPKEHKAVPPCNIQNCVIS